MIRLSIVVALALIVFPWCSEVTAGELENKVDSLFMLASTPEAHFQHLVDPAREELGTMGETAVPRLVEKIGTDDARERHALANIFKRIGAVAVPYLTETLNTDNKDALTNGARCLGEIGDKSATPALLELFTHSAHSVRATSATAVGRCRDSSAVARLMGLMADQKYTVRKSAAVALGRIEHEDAIPRLAIGLKDPHYSVRMTSMEALEKIGPKSGEALLQMFAGLDKTAQHLSLELFGRLQYKPSRKIIRSQLESDNPYTRGFALEAVFNISRSEAEKTVRKKFQNEIHPFVLHVIAQAESEVDRP